MDWSTILGLGAGVAVLVVGAGGELRALFDGLWLLFVVGGALAATLIAFPLSAVGRLAAIGWNAFCPKAVRPLETIAKIVDMAVVARREGILALEGRLSKLDDPFLRQGVQMAIDGTAPALIASILRTELQAWEVRQQRQQRLVNTLGMYLVICGVLGAVLILIQEQPTGLSASQLAARMALPLLYGGLLGGVFAFPLSRKLAERTADETLVKRMAIEGVMAIQSGDNPRIVEHKLAVFLGPNERPRSNLDLYRSTVRRESWWERWRRKRQERTSPPAQGEESEREVEEEEEEEDDIVVEESK